MEIVQIIVLKKCRKVTCRFLYQRLNADFRSLATAKVARCATTRGTAVEGDGLKAVAAARMKEIMVIAMRQERPVRRKKMIDRSVIVTSRR